MEEGEGGLLQRERVVAGEVLRGEVEEGELAEVGGLAGARGGAAGDGRGGDEVLGGQVEDHLGVGAVRHGEIEFDGVAARPKIEDAGGFAFGLLSLGEGEDVRDLMRSGVVGCVEAEVFEEGRGVGKGGGIENNAGLSGGGDPDGPAIAGEGAPVRRGGELQQSEGEQEVACHSDASLLVGVVAAGSRRASQSF